MKAGGIRPRGNVGSADCASAQSRQARAENGYARRLIKCTVTVIPFVPLPKLVPPRGDWYSARYAESGQRRFRIGFDCHDGGQHLFCRAYQRSAASHAMGHQRRADVVCAAIHRNLVFAWACRAGAVIHSLNRGVRSTKAARRVGGFNHFFNNNNRGPHCPYDRSRALGRPSVGSGFRQTFLLPKARQDG